MPPSEIPPIPDDADFYARLTPAPVAAPKSSDSPSSPVVGNDAYRALQGGSAAQEVARREAALKSLTEKESAAMKPGMDKFAAATKNAPPAPPEQEKIGAPPQAEQFGKDAQNWTLAMAALSAVTGALSRQHATTALNAFAAGVKGYKEGRQEAFDNAYKSWQGATKAALDNNKQLTEKYKAIIDNRELTENEAIQELKMVGLEYHDQLMVSADSLDHAIGIFNSQLKEAEKAQDETRRMDQWYAKFQKQQDAKKSGGILEPAMYEELKTRPEVIGAARAYAHGASLTPMFGWGKDNPMKIAAERLAYEQNPDMDWTVANTRFKALSSQAHGLGNMSAKITVASNLLDRSIPALMAQAEKVGLSPSTDLNTVYNEVKRRSSNKEFENFSTQLRAVTSEYGVLTGKGRLTVHDDQQALNILQANMGITSLEGFRDAANIERQNAMAGLNDTFQGLGTIGAPAGTPTPGTAPAAGGGNAPPGVDPSIWQHMTPEEKALWQTPSP